MTAAATWVTLVRWGLVHWGLLAAVPVVGSAAVTVAIYLMSPAERAAGRADQFRREGRCPGCGYDVRATPQRCPECGHVDRCV